MWYFASFGTNFTFWGRQFFIFAPSESRKDKYFLLEYMYTREVSSNYWRDLRTFPFQPGGVESVQPGDESNHQTGQEPLQGLHPRPGGARGCDTVRDRRTTARNSHDWPRHGIASLGGALVAGCQLCILHPGCHSLDPSWNDEIYSSVPENNHWIIIWSEILFYFNIH